MLEDLQNSDAPVCVGRDYDGWDLEVRGGRLGSARLLVAFEDNGNGNQYLRFRAWPCPSRQVGIIAAGCGAIAATAAFAHSALMAVAFGAVGAALFVVTIGHCAAALARIWAVVPATRGE
jgi:hypothetical protein